MKLDKISSISEIAKYYGTLDQVFRLLNKLNTTTRKIWNNMSVKLSEDIQRRVIKIDWNSRELFVDIPIEEKFMLSLFQSSTINVKTEASLEMLLELFENVNNPQMIKMYIGVSLSDKRDTWLTLSNYTEYMKYTNLIFLELYNKIIETAIRKQICLDMLRCFVFVHEIPDLKEVKYIRSILFPWNKSSYPESMISIWTEFWESKKFKFFEVFLIWDDMEIDQFLKIFSAVSDTVCKLKIHANKNNPEFFKLFCRIWNYKFSLVSIKIWDKEEHILWNTVRNNNEIYLRKWYYQTSFDSRKAVELSNLFIKYQNNLIENRTTTKSFSLEKIEWIQFYCSSSSVLPNHELKKLSNWIHFDQKEIQFEKEAIISSNLKVEISAKKSFFEASAKPIGSYQASVKQIGSHQARIKYFQKEHLISLEIQNKALEKVDFENLILEIPELGNVKILSLLISDPSCIIDILNWCNKIRWITSVTIKLATNINFILKHNIRKIANELKRQKIRVTIYEKNQAVKKIIS